MDDHKTCLEKFDKEMQKNKAAGENHDIIPFDIESEFSILKDIRDIEEELLMMHHVVEQQEYALGQLHHGYRHHGPERPGDDISYDGMTGFYTLPQSPMSRRRGWNVKGWKDQAALGQAYAGSTLSDDDPGEHPQYLAKNRQSKARSHTVPGSKDRSTITVSDPGEKEGRPHWSLDPGPNPKPSGLGDLLLRAEKRGSILVKLSDKAHATEKSVCLVPT